MTEIRAQAVSWSGLALLATLLSIWLKVAAAPSEIVVGTIAQLVIGAALGGAPLAGDAPRPKSLAIDEGQYPALAVAVALSAVVPTLIANALFPSPRTVTARRTSP
jgi:hypothetical protein